MDRMTRAALWIAARYWDRTLLRLSSIAHWLRFVSLDARHGCNRRATCQRLLHRSSEGRPVRAKKTRQKQKAWAFKEEAANRDVPTSQERASLRSGCLPRFQWSGGPPCAALVGLPRRRLCIRYIGGRHRHGRPVLRHKPGKLTRAKTLCPTFQLLLAVKRPMTHLLASLNYRRSLVFKSELCSPAENSASDTTSKIKRDRA